MKKFRSIARARGLTVLPLTPESVHRALDLCVAGAVTRRSRFDRQLAAVMVRGNIPVSITENDRDFAGIAGITAVNSRA